MNFPGTLDDAIATWLAENAKGQLADKTAQLSASYRKGATSSHVDTAAYLVARVPATFAANVRMQQALAAAMPDLAPLSLLDMGAGPGTASWAALSQWPTLLRVTLCEQDKAFAGLATKLNGASGLEPLQTAALLLTSEATLADAVRADMVIASYMLAELPVQDMAKVASRLWARTQQVLLLLEPGTPQGFARLHKVRETLTRQGAFVIAPCTHQLACPMVGKDWCHFKTRVQRSRAHMHAKQATVPFEDEAFSYLVLSRAAVPQHGARILSPPDESKVRVTLRLCQHGDIKEAEVASRDRPAYKRAKKARWGDVWE